MVTSNSTACLFRLFGCACPSVAYGGPFRVCPRTTKGKVWPRRQGRAGRRSGPAGSAACTAGAGLAPDCWCWCCSEPGRSEEHTSELQSRGHLVCRLLLEKKKRNKHITVRELTSVVTG